MEGWLAISRASRAPLPIGLDGGFLFLRPPRLPPAVPLPWLWFPRVWGRSSWKEYLGAATAIGSPYLSGDVAVFCAGAIRSCCAANARWPALEPRRLPLLLFESPVENPIASLPFPTGCTGSSLNGTIGISYSCFDFLGRPPNSAGGSNPKSSTASLAGRLFLYLDALLDPSRGF